MLVSQLIWLKSHLEEKKKIDVCKKSLARTPQDLRAEGHNLATLHRTSLPLDNFWEVLVNSALDD